MNDLQGILSLGVIFICVGICLYLSKKDKIYRYKNGNWMDIIDNPLPADIKDFIATDGKQVKPMSKPDWGPHGKVYFNFMKDTFITHWMPLPDVPKGK